MAHDVFICHASQDRPVANTICSLLESKGLQCWIAPRDVPPGRFGGAIMDAVSQSRIMVLVFSIHANNSFNCLSEVHSAFNKKITILPVQIDDTAPSGDMEYYLQMFHWLDARTPPLEKHLHQLADTVKSMLAEMDAKDAAARKRAEQAAEEARAKQKAAEAIKEKERQEAEAAGASKEREKADQAREAALKARLETETAGQALRAAKPSKVRTTWIWSGVGTLTIVVIGVILLFTKPWSGTGAIPPLETTTPITGISANTTTPPPKTTTATPTTAPTTSPPPTTTPPPTTSPPVVVVPTGTINIAVTDFGYESTDPNYHESQWGWCMYDQLISWDEHGNYTGAIALDWSVSPDGNTWTFHIRQGVKFHNGDPLTAADVKFSVDRFGSDNSTNPWSTYLSTKYNKASSAVIDDYTFQYVTNHPEPALIIPFAQTRILPKNYFENVGQDYFRAHPVGSGPWKFVEHTADTSFTMEANTDYWGQVPAFKYAKFLQLPDEATQVTMLQRGEVDIITVSPDRLAQLQQSGWRTVEVGMPKLANINFQGTWLANDSPVHDIRIRQAMSYAINRQEICNTYYHGNAVPGGQWYIQPGAYGWSDALAADTYDPAKAKNLMMSAGYPNGITNPIHIYATAETVDFLQLLQVYWTDVGIHVQIDVVDSPTWLGYLFSFNNRLTGTEPNVGGILYWSFESVFNSIYHAENMYCSWGAHNTANDPVADAMYNDATSELDPVKALQKWTAFQVYAKSMYVDIGICQIKPLIVVSSNLGEFTGKNWMSLYDALAGIQHKK
jgi:ABC-type transport system substrate-binding protein